MRSCKYCSLKYINYSNYIFLFLFHSRALFLSHSHTHIYFLTRKELEERHQQIAQLKPFKYIIRRSFSTFILVSLYPINRMTIKIIITGWLWTRLEIHVHAHAPPVYTDKHWPKLFSMVCRFDGSLQNTSDRRVYKLSFFRFRLKLRIQELFHFAFDLPSSRSYPSTTRL